MVDGEENVAPYDVDFGPGDTIDLSFVVEDELPLFARLEVVDLPDFLHLDGTTKRIVGIAPFEADSYYLVLTATDIGGLSDRATIYLNVTSSLAPPQLWSEIIDPSEGDVYTNYEISVVYVSIDNRAPVYVRADFGDNETAEMVPVNITDDEYRAGVTYHVFVRLEDGNHEIHIEVFDGINTNRTEEPLEVEVSSFSFEITNQELAIIIVTLIATVIIILIIRQTSDRYKTMKEAHYGLDKEDELEYIEPGETSAEEEDEEEVEADDDEVEEPIKGDDGQVHVMKMDEDDMRHLDEDVERLDGELDEIDSDIDSKEEELARIDEEIEDIIDELDQDRNRVS